MRVSRTIIDQLSILDTSPLPCNEIHFIAHKYYLLSIVDGQVRKTFTRNFLICCTLYNVHFTIYTLQWAMDIVHLLPKRIFHYLYTKNKQTFFKNNSRLLNTVLFWDVSQYWLNPWSFLIKQKLVMIHHWLHLLIPFVVWSEYYQQLNHTECQYIIPIKNFVSQST